jgi:hypothetical protein
MLDHVSVVPNLLAYTIEILDIAISHQGRHLRRRPEDRPHRETPASTIEALLYELRSGLSCLADEDACNRLRSCDEGAMRTIAAELLSWKDKNKPWLPVWSEDDVAKLLAVKGGLK